MKKYEREELKEASMSIDDNIHRILVLAVSQLMKKDVKHEYASKEEYKFVLDHLRKVKL
jgi:hypothetical protein